MLGDATFSGDRSAANDHDDLVLSDEGGFVAHNLGTIGTLSYHSAIDFDPTVPDDQPLPTGAGGTITIDLLGGDNSLTIDDTATAFLGGQAITWLNTGGSNTLAGPSAANTWNVTAPDAGGLNGLLDFSNVGNLVGNSNIDTFTLGGGTLSGEIIGGLGSDVLDYSAYAAAFPIAVDLGAGTATDVAGGVSGVEDVVGGAGDDTIDGDSGDNVLADGPGSDQLDGGGGNDRFVLTLGGADVVTGTVAGNDTVDFSKSAEAITIDMDAAGSQAVHAGGDTVTLVGQIENFLGSGFDDTVSVAALASGEARSMDGGGGAGDLLNVDAAGRSVTVSGNTMTFSGGYGDVTLNGWQQINISNAAAVIVQGGAGNDNAILEGVGAPNSGRFSLNGGLTWTSFSATSFTFDGLGGHDTLTVDFGAGNPIPSGGLGFNGGSPATSPGDRLLLQNGSFTTIEYTPTAVDSGTIDLDGSNVDYSGLESTDDTTTSANLVLNGTAVGETITVSDGTIVGGLQTTRVSAPTFENLQFANKTSVVINGQNGGDTLNLTATLTTPGLAVLALNGEDAANAADDDAPDTFNIVATRPATTTTVDGGGGSDRLVGPNLVNTWSVTGADTGSLSGAVGFSATENLAGGADDDSFDLRAGGSVSGSIAGNGESTSDVLTYAGRTTTATVNLETDSATDVAALSGMESFVGSAAIGDVLIGENNLNAWDVTGAGSGDVDGVLFASFEDLVGGAEVDAFAVRAAIGNLYGRDGTDEFNLFHGAAVTGAIEAEAGSDVLRIDHSMATGGLVTGTFAFHGGLGSDWLVMQGDPGLPAAARETYVTGPSIGLTSSDGFLLIDPDDSAGGGADYPNYPALTSLSGDELLVSFTGLSPIIDTTPSPQLDVFATPGADTIRIVDGPGIGGFTTTLVDDGGAGLFESIEFANKVNVTINGVDGADTVSVNNPNPATGLSTLSLYGNEVSGGTVNPDDGAADVFHIQAIAVATLVSGQDGNDVINVGATGNSLNGIQGSLSVDGGGNLAAAQRNVAAGGSVVPGIPYSAASRFVPATTSVDVGDTLNVLDNAQSSDHTYQVDSTTVVRDGAPSFSYANIELTNLETGSGDDQVLITMPVMIPPAHHIITFDGNGGTDGLRIRGTVGDDKITVDDIATDPALRAPYEIADVESLHVDGRQGNDVIVNDTGSTGAPMTSVESLLEGGLGDDVLVGGYHDDVIFGGSGIDAILARKGSDWLFADMDALGTIIGYGGELILGNDGNGNDTGYWDSGMAIVPAGDDADYLDEVEGVYDVGASKGVVTWLLGVFPDFDLTLVGGRVYRSDRLELLRQEALATLPFSPILEPADGMRQSTIGLYAPTASTFLLRNSNDTGFADHTFGYGPAGSTWTPIVGDWNGDGTDTVGLYAPDSGTFFLNNANATQNADMVFGYGPGGLGWIPLAGDWNGDGVDTIGVYAPDSSVFFLNNANATQNADMVFGYGPGGLGWIPLADDWDGDGVDTIGVYAPDSSVFFLNNTNATQHADVTFGYGPGGLGWVPLTGDFNGPSYPLHAAGQPSGAAAPLGEADVESILSQAAADWAADVPAGIDVVITDLPGAQLGLAELDTIYLDRDAAGHGWFVDPTPGTDEEFQAGPGGILRAVDARAVDRIDLLTVVGHELGHLLGLEDLDSRANSLMNGLLEPGMRRTPGPAEIDLLLRQAQE